MFPSVVYSNQMGSQISDFSPLWTITPPPPSPTPTPTPFLFPPPVSPPNIRLVPLSPTNCHRTLEV